MNDTICAISTATGIGAISIIRVSGPEAITIVNPIFKGTDLSKVASHTIHYGHVIDQDQIIDEVLVTVMKSPKTFTTEDTVEINCHGGVATTNRILELLITNGARQAEGGEFTKRAFLNGRIDLLKSEAVSDLIVAQSEKERSLAMNQLTGKVSNLVQAIRQKLVSLEANIEVNIDYPEYDDVEEITLPKANQILTDVRKDLQNLLNEARNGQIIKDGINITLIGRPNVGKSSLLNAFLKEEKAIVTDIAGTTRDVVEGCVLIDGIKINFYDTAGIHETTDKVEQIGVNRSKKTLDKANLAILVLNGNEPLTKEDQELLEILKKIPYFIFVNKNDLPLNLDSNVLPNVPIVYGNTLKDDGIDELKANIIQHFHLDKIESLDPTYLSNARHIALVKKSLSAIDAALEGIKQNAPIDMIEIDIMSAWNTLGEITGETYKDELINELFSKFCLGK